MHVLIPVKMPLGSFPVFSWSRQTLGGAHCGAKVLSPGWTTKLWIQG